jgi:hypothetical protein
MNSGRVFCYKTLREFLSIRSEEKGPE